MWVVLTDEGGILASFPAGRNGWQRAVRYATEQGGELDVVFMPHVRPTIAGGGWKEAA